MAARLPKSDGFDQCTIAAANPAVVTIPARPRRNRLPSSPASANRRFPSCSGHRGPTRRSCLRQSQRSGRGFGRRFEDTRLAQQRGDTTGSRSWPHRGRQPVIGNMFTLLSRHEPRSARHHIALDDQPSLRYRYEQAALKCGIRQSPIFVSARSSRFSFRRYGRSAAASVRHCPSSASIIRSRQRQRSSTDCSHGAERLPHGNDAPKRFHQAPNLAEPFVAQRSSSHRTQLSSCPSRLRRPCSVITQGRSTYGGSWRTC